MIAKVFDGVTILSEPESGIVVVSGVNEDGSICVTKNVDGVNYSRRVEATDYTVEYVHDGGPIIVEETRMYYNGKWHPL